MPILESVRGLVFLVGMVARLVSIDRFQHGLHDLSLILVVTAVLLWSRVTPKATMAPFSESV